jgi:Fe-S-cluster containining protein
MRYIFDGWQMVAMKDHLGQWWKVAVPCQRCGACCKDRVGQQWPREIENWIDETGRCKWLSQEGEVHRCDLLNHRPQSCSTNSPHKRPAHCKAVLEPVDDPLSLL